MFWMLHEAGASYAEIARAADLSDERVRQLPGVAKRAEVTPIELRFEPRAD